MRSPRKSPPPQGKTRTVRRTLADGTVKEYRYGPRKKKPSAAIRDTLATLVRAFEASPEYRDKARSTQQQYAIYLKPWAKLGHLRAKDIRRRHVLELRDAIAKARGAGAATAFVRVASVLFGWAVEREWLDASPAAKVPVLPGGHHRPWTDAETQHARDNLPSHLARVVELAELIGQRRGDLCALMWSAYDGQTIRLTQQKTGVVVVLPLPLEARTMLDRWKRAAKAVTILTNAHGQPWTGEHLSREMKRATEELGLRGLTLHGLRRRAAVRIANAGGSTHEIAAVTGHRTLQMVQLYTQGVDQQRLAEAALARVSNKSSKTARKGR